MPSPFPGMDPWLENPVRWPGVHHHLISAIQDQLGGQLRPRYVALVEERVYISDDRDPGRRYINPDLHLAETEYGPSERIDITDESGGIAVAEPVVRVTLLDKEIHEPYLTLVDVNNREIVTVIEVLSPTNKCRGSEGQKNYLRKRHDIMESSANLVEIDLLREGDPILVEPGLPECQYTAHVSQPRHRPKGLVWPIRLDQRLPTLPIPLRPDEQPARLDLQAGLASFYDRAGYDLILDYTREPVPPLPRDWDEWAERVLRNHRLRA